MRKREKKRESHAYLMIEREELHSNEQLSSDKFKI